MVGISALIHGGCAATVFAFALGIYRQKPQIGLIERRLASFGWPVQATILGLLILLFMSGLDMIEGKLNLPLYFVDLAGLIVHEAGHFYMSWAGRFVHAFGGTLFEIGVPAGLAAWFLVSGRKRLGALALSWLYVALTSVAAYAGDAQDLQLPLLGASDLIEDKMAGHDWHVMLSMLNLLDATELIADIIWSTGLVAGLASILLYSWTLLAGRSGRSSWDQKLS